METARLLNFRKIMITAEHGVQYNAEGFKIYCGENLMDIYTFSESNGEIIIELTREINIKKKCTVQYGNHNIALSCSDLFLSEEFNKRYFYSGNLGCIYSEEKTLFRVWSPIAEAVTLQIYKSGDTDLKETPEKIPMNEINGVWQAEINRDLRGYFYTYMVKAYDKLEEAVDPYARAVGINGMKAAVINLKDTEPEDFYNDNFKNSPYYTDAVIYEMSIRDISMNINSGIRNKGKFTGLTEENTVNSNNELTGLSHLKELGITHVQLMPVFDFSYKSTDERNSQKYNWGYDPQNYNVPEGSYSTDAKDPICRIFELKAMIQRLHKNGIGIIMDVVYNHVFSEKDNNFEKICPGYYFRQNPDGSFVKGSGCQNDTASERPMFRKFMIDSVLYWAEEYHMDGFRFDLMGLHDIDTMNLIKEKLDNLRKNIIVYGEGWSLDTLLADEQKAKMVNSYKTPHIGYFNDIIRDAVKGSVFINEDKGFVSGKENLEHIIKKCAAGCIDYSEGLKGPFLSPEQSLNYVSCHDNHTLWDKIDISCREYSSDVKKSMQKLANAIVITSQGIPFLHSGEEFCRTKYHSDNSYNLPDNINSIDWDKKSYFGDVFKYYKGLIDIRKNHPAFRMKNAEDIKKHLVFLENTPKNTVAFMIKDNANNDIWKNILVIYNADRNPAVIDVPYGTYCMTADGRTAGCSIIRRITGNKIKAEAISMSLFYSMDLL